MSHFPAGSCAPVEHLKDILQLFLGNPYSVVLNLNLVTASSLECPECHSAPFLGVPYCIAEKVLEAPVHEFFVHLHYCILRQVNLCLEVMLEYSGGF